MPDAQLPTSICRRCNGNGVIANNSTGRAERCPDCNGRRLTDAEYRELAASSTSSEPMSLGPVCEGCGRRTADPTYAEMDPFCPACVAALSTQHVCPACGQSPPDGTHCGCFSTQQELTNRD